MIRLSPLRGSNDIARITWGEAQAMCLLPLRGFILNRVSPRLIKHAWALKRSCLIWRGQSGPASSARS